MEACKNPKPSGRVIEVTLRYRAADLPVMAGDKKKQFVIDMLREQRAFAVDAADMVDVKWLP